MSPIALIRHQLNFDLLIFRRNPAGTFFTVVLPLIFLVIFTSIFGNQTLDNGAKVATLYVPGILTLAIVSATAVNVAITMTTRRERGVLKRVRGTPVPGWIFVLSQALSGVVIALLMTVIISLVGRVLYGVEVQFETLPSLLISLLLGAMAFSAIGLALTRIITSEDAAPAVTNAIFLPLYFVSGVFVPDTEVPSWVGTVGNLFPVSHLNKALQESFDPFADGAAWPWDHWLVIAGWGIVAAVITLKTFRWSPNR
ncbi:MAG: ABC transporter permease [Acidimicrobiia bacterium]|nr:ABC transporter permease [Acidimicrobiia bacterium]